MKILNVNMSIDPVKGGGTAERTVQMSRHLSMAGQSCTILTLDLGLSPERRASIEEDGVRVIALPCINRRFYLPLVSPLAIFRLVRDSDVIQLMSHWTILNVLVYAAARMLRKPYVVCPAGSLAIFGRMKPLKHAFNAVVGGPMVRGAAMCIACAPAELPHFENLGASGDKVVVIPNGINIEDYAVGDATAFRKEFSLGDSPIILFVGRLNAIKGPDLLVRAFADTSNRIPHTLVLAGPDDGMQRELTGICDEAGIAGRVRFTGYLSGAMKVGAYLAAQLVAIPSRSEPMSIVLLEAGASSAPVLITDQSGFDGVEALGGGFVVEASALALAEGLMRAWSERDRLPSMGAILHRHVVDNFSWTIVVQRYMDLYTAILASPRRGVA